MSEGENQAGQGALKAVLFDKDGTLFDFTATWGHFCDRMLDHLAPKDQDLRDQLAEAVGYDRSNRRFLPGSLIVNASAAEVDAAWAALAPDHDLSAVETLTRAELKQLPVVPTCDLSQVMQALRDQGLQLGVATNDYELGALNQLTQAGALDLFDFVCGCDSGYGRKPEPGMINGFCAKFDLRPDQVVFVGDSTHDMHCGLNAGAGYCVGVLTGPATVRDLDMAAVVLDSIDDLPAHLQHLGGARNT